MKRAASAAARPAPAPRASRAPKLRAPSAPAPSLRKAPTKAESSKPSPSSSSASTKKQSSTDAAKSLSAILERISALKDEEASSPETKLQIDEEEPLHRADAISKQQRKIGIDKDDDNDEDDDDGDSRYRVKLRIGTVALPPGLVRAVAHITKGQKREAISSAGAALSEALRARTRSALPADSLGRIFNTQDIPTLAYNELQATAYIAHRLPGVYACITRVLGELRARLPDWIPRRMLDFGSGPGTAVWAAHTAWPQDLRTFTMVDRSPHMVRIAKTITTELSVKHGVQLSWRRHLQHVPAHDLVMCSYVLSELHSDKERTRELNELWARVEPNGVLLVVEPGTPLGFEYVKRARAQILELPSASVIAPCPHANACPMKDDTWCHFAQRVQRTPWQMRAKKDASINWEDEKFSYIALRKGPTPPADFARIVRAPMKRGGHVLMVACNTSGFLETRTVTKSQGAQRYRQAVKTKWGDGFRTQLP